MNIIDLSYYHSVNIQDPDLLLQQHRPNIEYVKYLPYGCHTSIIKFMNSEGSQEMNGVSYYYFHGHSSKYWIPYSKHNFIKQLKPTVIILHGLVYPLQTILLRWQLGKDVKIIVQHHAEIPTGGKRGFLQKMADQCIDAYLFTTKELALPWVEKGVIKCLNKVIEMVEGSTHFARINKEKAKSISGISGDENFLWVGRLDHNKNPILVVKAFLKYAQSNPSARLYMIYQQNDLEKELLSILEKEDPKRQSVVLVGKKAHEELVYWYSSADFYISGSYKEGSGYALIEAMACGCIPIVTSIPSFRKITSNGKLGFLYETGNIDSLYQSLCATNSICKTQLTAAIQLHFQENLSFQHIADTIYATSKSLIERKGP
ncbi:glycosyltransferase family 4 protein [Chitinophagaceae bacterium LB-8]|uniref:Glycosyltransferase family 4 protein n=1 Tax=Paraflavisolibacter caeni TaxID=2982496 RepID=A0A9X2XV66_9BACT|nr:glycosyltransferase family 4 protein [Paraflavisolibacter caeni]MCU7548972.1 glycosyltransferase family 4 protein [Paraflavisolibacter caeni]